MPRYSTNRELGKLATANAERRQQAEQPVKAKAQSLPDPDRWGNMKSAQPPQDNQDDAQ